MENNKIKEKTKKKQRNHRRKTKNKRKTKRKGCEREANTTNGSNARAIERTGRLCTVASRKILQRGGHTSHYTRDIALAYEAPAAKENQAGRRTPLTLTLSGSAPPMAASRCLVISSAGRADRFSVHMCDVVQDAFPICNMPRLETEAML